MYFKVDRKVLKKALVWLKKQSITNTQIDEIYDIDGKLVERKLNTFSNNIPSYIEQVEFALYKTKMEEFYIDYDFAQAIRPALLTKKAVKRD